jgi:acylphosphatase
MVRRLLRTPWLVWTRTLLADYFGAGDQTGAVIRRRVVAHGRVQGVFFRDTCRRQARARRVSGWVANREDGAVEAIFEGEAAAVQAMVHWARKGPPQAYVTELEIIEEEPRGERGFSVR